MEGFGGAVKHDFQAEADKTKKVKSVLRHELSRTVQDIVLASQLSEDEVKQELRRLGELGEVYESKTGAYRLL